MLQILKLAKTFLSGDIPFELAALTSLQNLDLSSSNFRREIPSFLGKLTALSKYSERRREARGSHYLVRAVSQCIHALLLYLIHLCAEFLSLHENKFSGTIPADLGNLSELVHLSLNGNELVGPLPVELGRLTSLDTLVLEGNGLTGRVHLDVCRLRQQELIVFTTDCSVICPVPNCCTSCEAS